MDGDNIKMFHGPPMNIGAGSGDAEGVGDISGTQDGITGGGGRDGISKGTD